MTDEMLIWHEEPGEDVLKEACAGDEGSPWLVGENKYTCCSPLVWIDRVNGAFKLVANYAHPDDPVRRENVFATVSDAIITFAVLNDLTDQDLKELGVASLGHRRQLLRAFS
jgi:hypothetical protein